jgi:hypothetical protein
MLSLFYFDCIKSFIDALEGGVILTGIILLIVLIQKGEIGK